MIALVGLGLLLSRQSQPTGDPNLDAYDRAFVIRGRIMIVGGIVFFIISVLIQLGLVDPR